MISAWRKSLTSYLVTLLTKSAASKGPPPSVSALSQHLNLLRRKNTSDSANSAATTPATASTKRAATGTFGSAGGSRGKNGLFSRKAAKATRAAADTDDSEGDAGDTCASTASPTPTRGSKGSTLGKRNRDKEENELDDTPIAHQRGHAFMDQLKAAASQADNGEDVKVKQEKAWSSESVKKAKIERVRFPFSIVVTRLTN